MNANKRRLYKSIHTTERTISASFAGCGCVPACTLNGGSKAAHEAAFDRAQFGR